MYYSKCKAFMTIRSVIKCDENLMIRIIILRIIYIYIYIYIYECGIGPPDSISMELVIMRI